jgi:succinate-semialdehyde dehydrogenase/glutarate-semialdehyde dehydrogenase
MKSINPATERVIAEYPEHSGVEVEHFLGRAEAAFAEWRERSFQDRAVCMNAAAGALRARRGELAALMTSEMGKTIVSAEAEVEKCAAACDYFAANAANLLAERPIASDAARSFVRYEPLGPVLAVMPWNFPLWQVFRFAAPGLMAGNVGLLKHSSNVPGCALAIEEIFREVRFPQGAFTTLLISAQEAEKLIAHPAIRAVTLTGSDAAGRHIAAAAGRAIKKSVLELGGSDPFMVIPPVDIDATAAAAAAARCINNGQSCIAAKRFIVIDAIADRFEAALVEKMKSLRMGDPMDRGTDVGPMARGDLRDSLHDQVERSVRGGARLLCGGRPRAGRGYYYPPTVLGGVRPGMAGFDEETFGPVAAVVRAGDVEEVVALANRSRFGLGASVWTDDVALAERLAGRLEAGCVFINGPVKSDARLPFGGVKESGYGRELADVGIREFVNVMTVWFMGT